MGKRKNIIPNNLSKPWSVTEIVAAEYCENKAILDLKYGDKPSPSIKKKRINGTIDHKRFEKIGKEILTEQRNEQVQPGQHRFVNLSLLKLIRRLLNFIIRCVGGR